MTLQVGNRVRILKDIWDDGQDHYLPGYIAHRGEVVTIKGIDRYGFLCAHDWVTDDRTFLAYRDEIEEAQK